MTLNAKEEQFCKLIALEEKSHYDAQIETYPHSKNWSRNAIDVQAAKRIAKPKISLRIEELKATLTNKVIEGFAKSREDILSKLESLITKAETAEQKVVAEFSDGKVIKGMSTKDSIKEIRDCLVEQGKLLGYYVNKEAPTDKDGNDAPLTNININFVTKKETSTSD